MAHTKGLVINIKKEGWAQVLTERKEACSGCQSTHNCHGCLTNSKMVAEVLNKAGAKEGDLVDISLDTSFLLKGAAILYLIPVAGLLAGALLGNFLNLSLAIDETNAAIAFGFAGLCLGFLITATMAKRMSKNNRLTPKISHIITRGTGRSPLLAVIDPAYKTKVCSDCN